MSTSTLVIGSSKEVLKAGFYQRRSRSLNRKRRAIRSSENQTDRVGSKTPYSPTTPSLTIQWKLDCRSRKHKRKNKPITMLVSGHCDWLILLFLLPTPTMKFALNRKRRNRRRNRKKKETFRFSDSDSVELLIPLTTLIFNFHKVISALTLTYLLRLWLRLRRQWKQSFRGQCRWPHLPLPQPMPLLLKKTLHAQTDPPHLKARGPGNFGCLVTGHCLGGHINRKFLNFSKQRYGHGHLKTLDKEVWIYHRYQQIWHHYDTLNNESKIICFFNSNSQEHT